MTSTRSGGKVPVKKAPLATPAKRGRKRAVKEVIEEDKEIGENSNYNSDPESGEEGISRKLRMVEPGHSNDMVTVVTETKATRCTGKQKDRLNQKTSTAKRYKMGATNEASTSHQNDSRITTTSWSSKITDILPVLSLDQRKAITEIGFGGLLETKLSEVPNDMNEWLIESFNPHARAMMQLGKILYHITPGDVHDIFLLPYCPDNPVDEESDESIQEIRYRWEEEFGFSSKPSGKTELAKLKEAMLKLVDGNHDFKRMFVLYTLSGFLAPVASETVDFRPLKSMLVTADINKYDWCGFVLDKMCTATKMFKGDSQTEQKFAYSGCILVLLISYMQRVNWRGFPSPRTRPFIKNWTPESLDLRIRQEVAAGGFGKWPLDTLTYPITKVVESSEPSFSNNPAIIFPIRGSILDDARLEKLFPNAYQRNVAKLLRDVEVVFGDRRFEQILKKDGLQAGFQFCLPTSTSSLVQNIDIVVQNFLKVKEVLLVQENPALSMQQDGLAIHATEVSPPNMDIQNGNGVQENSAPSMREDGVPNNDAEVSPREMDIQNGRGVQENSALFMQENGLVIHAAEVSPLEMDIHNGSGMYVSPPCTTSIAKDSLGRTPDAEPTQPLPVSGNAACDDCLNSKLPITPISGDSVARTADAKPDHALTVVKIAECDNCLNSELPITPISGDSVTGTTEAEHAHALTVAKNAESADCLNSELPTTSITRDSVPGTTEAEAAHPLPVAKNAVCLNTEDVCKLSAGIGGTQPSPPKQKVCPPQAGMNDEHHEVGFQSTAVTNEQHLSTPEHKRSTLSGMNEQEHPSPTKYKESPWCDWPTNTEALHMSSLVSRVISKSHTLPGPYLEIADFCVSDTLLDTYSNTPFYDDGFLALQRIDFNPFERRGIISAKLMNVWSRVLNRRSSDECPSSHIYMAAAHSFDKSDGDDDVIVQEWEKWLVQCPKRIINAELIFIPAEIDNHYFLLVLNFKTESLQYLDSSLHKCKSKWVDAPKIILRKLHTLLCRCGHDQAATVEKFKIETITGEWRMGAKKSNAGIYVMHLMKHYSGDPKSLMDISIDQVYDIEVLRVCFCCEILMNHANHKKDQLLSAVLSHIEEKKSFSDRATNALVQ